MTSSDFCDEPCAWAHRNPRRNAGGLTCEGGPCLTDPRLCARRRRHLAARPGRKPTLAEKRTAVVEALKAELGRGGS